MCLALGSGQEAEGTGPTYYGSRDVIYDLIKAPGYATGLVELSADGPLRCPITGKILHLRFKD
eukprot:12688765-Heterocapsa_arctica.AAC.1